MAKNTTKANVQSKPVTKPAADVQATVKADVEQVKAEMAALLDGVKEAFRALNDRDIKLSDKVLSEVLARAKGWDDMDDDAKMAFLLKAEETAGKVSVTDPGISALIAKMDAPFHKEVAAILTANRKSKASAVDMLAQMRRIYTLTEMNGFRMPGLDTENAEGTGYLPAKYKTKDRTTGDSISVNWVNDFADFMPEGKTACDIMVAIDKEWDNPGTTTYRALTKEDLSDTYEAAKQDRNGLRSVVGRAIKLHHRLIAIGKLNSCGIRFINGSTTKGISMPTKYGQVTVKPEDIQSVSMGPKPLWLFDAAEPSKGRDFSVTQVLAFQPHLAKLGENGGNMADLIATAGKGADDEETADGNKAGETMANDEAQATGSIFINFLSKMENRASVMKAIADYKKNTDGVEWLGIFMELDKFVHPIAEKNRNTYLAIQNAKMLNADDAAEEEVEAVVAVA